MKVHTVVIRVTSLVFILVALGIQIFIEFRLKPVPSITIEMAVGLICIWLILEGIRGDYINHRADLLQDQVDLIVKRLGQL